MAQKFLFILMNLLFFGCYPSWIATTVKESGLFGQQAQNETLTRLAGTWKSDCQLTNSTNNDLGAMVFILTLNADGSYHYLIEGYQDSCQTQVVEFEESGLITLSEAISGIPTQYEIDLTLSRTTFFIYQVSHTFLNSISYCGKNDWTTSLEYSLWGFSGCSLASVPEIRHRDEYPLQSSPQLYDLIGYDGTSLYLSDLSSQQGLTPGQRPATLLTFPLHRQN